MRDENYVLDEQKTQFMLDRINMLNSTPKKKKTNTLGTTKFIPPQFGIMSRKNRKDNKKFNTELNETINNENYESSNSIINQLAYNTYHDEGYSSNESTINSPPRSTYPSRPPISNNKVKQAFHIIQHKYEENLNVVDDLYKEKTSLEEYTRKLEEEIERLRERRLARDDKNDDYENYKLEKGSEEKKTKKEVGIAAKNKKEDENEDEDHILPTYDEVMSENEIVDSNTSNKLSKFKLTAEQIAELFLESDQSHTRGRSRQSHRPLSASTGYLTTRSEPNAETLRSRSLTRLSGNNSRQSSRGRPASSSRLPRSSSQEPSPRVVRKVSGISPHLQADADRYVQKQKLDKEIELKKKQEEEEYLNYLKNRTLNASINGKEFQLMKIRDEQIKKKKLEKEKELLIKKKEEELKKKKEEMENLKKKQNLMSKGINGMNWKELNNLNELKRKEKIEQNKQEILLQTSNSIPENLNNSIKNYTVKVIEYKNIEKNPQLYKFPIDTKREPCKSPKKIVETLEKQQKIWNKKIENEKLKIKEENNLLKDYNINNVINKKNSLELRYEEYKKKNDEKKKLKEEKEKKELEETKLNKERMYKKLINSNTNYTNKLTKTEELKIKQLKEKKLKELKELEDKKEQEKLKKQKEKENSISIRLALEQRKETLKAKNPNYIELSPQELEITMKRKQAQARQEFRERIRANKDQIENSLKNRKSLLE